MPFFYGTHHKHCYDFDYMDFERPVGVNEYGEIEFGDCPAWMPSSVPSRAICCEGPQDDLPNLKLTGWQTILG
jgi:hypothetical protein